MLVLACLAGACGGGTDTPRTSAEPTTSSPPPASEFVDEIDNPWMPWRVGTRWTFLGTTAEGTERTVVTVTDRTRVVDGVTTTVVHDVVHLDGRLLEDTYDWYAQDSVGNVWYFGEDTTEYSGTKADTTGSWEAGVDGALPGVIVPAEPEVGMTYRQEHYAGEAEDAAAVLSLSERAEVPYGSFTDVLLTKDFTPLEPEVLEYKLYAPGVGPVLVLGVSGGADREELLQLTTP